MIYPASKNAFIEEIMVQLSRPPSSPGGGPVYPQNWHLIRNRSSQLLLNLPEYDFDSSYREAPGVLVLIYRHPV